MSNYKSKNDAITYPNETIMEEHPKEASWDLGITDGGIENRLCNDLLGLLACLIIVTRIKCCLRCTTYCDQEKNYEGGDNVFGRKFSHWS